MKPIVLWLSALGFGFFLALCTRRREWVDGLVASTCALAGFALLPRGRHSDVDNAGSLMYAVLGLEPAGAALSVWASKISDRR